MSLLNTPPKDYQTLFLDMDAFFASCEQQVNPTLRGKPVGVVPQMVDSGCIISPSYEAKRRGIKVGFNVAQARIKCPDIVFVEATPALYKQFHYQIAEILSHQSPWVEAKSIDEFSVKLSPSQQDYFTAQKVAAKIKDDIASSVGQFVTCSIGVSANYFLSKTASEMRKPNGTLILPLSEAEQALSKLELTDLCGIARGLSRRLRAEGVYSIKQLYQLTPQQLRRWFGFNGELWWYRLRGYEVDNVAWARKNIGHSHVLPPEWRTPEKARHVLNRLVHKVGQRLRKEGFWAKHVHLSLAYIGSGYYYNHQQTMPFCDSATMTQLANQLFDIRSQPSSFILQVAWTVSDLIQGCAMPEPLFPEMQKSLLLTHALDKINDRYGRDTIFTSSMMSARETAPDRIPFGRLRY